MNKGLIKISDIIYREQWDIFRLIFKDFKPTHIEFRHWENFIWYFYGDSELFDKIQHGDPIPEYNVLFSIDGPKETDVKYKFERIEYEKYTCDTN